MPLLLRACADTSNSLSSVGYSKFRAYSDDQQINRAVGGSSNSSCDDEKKDYTVQTASAIFSFRTYFPDQFFTFTLSNAAEKVRPVCSNLFSIRQLQIHSMYVCSVDVSGRCRLQSIFGNTIMSPPKLLTKDLGQQTVQRITVKSCSCTRTHSSSRSHLYYETHKA